MSSLENEFEKYKQKHKDKFLLQMVIRYYKDLEANEINIPYFLRRDEDRIERKAQADLCRIKKNPELYESLYAQAYELIAPKLKGIQA